MRRAILTALPATTVAAALVVVRTSRTLGANNAREASDRIRTRRDRRLGGRRPWWWPARRGRDGAARGEARGVRRLGLVLAVLAALVAPGFASAHPLGNFTVNRYAGIDAAGKDVYVRYAVDFAEIPAYQLGADVRRPGYPAELARDLELTIDGRRARLRVLDQRVRSAPGAAGLETLRLDVVYAAPRTGRQLEFRDHAFPRRIGWREITVSARDGARVLRSSVPDASESRALTEYPKSLLRSPLDVTSAAATIDPGTDAAAPPPLAPLAASARAGGGFEALIERGELSAGALVVSLLIAMFWGAAHALTPGHGKAMVAAYLVGTRGTARHAFMLGGTVTVAHTAGVFGMGVVTLALSRVVVPERLYPWLTLVSGVLVVAVGVAVLRQRLGARGRHDHHQHEHHHHHAHGDHSHDAAMTSKGILGVGLAAGLLPCPSALVVLLAAISLHRVGLGLVLILAFSVGLAATITAIGLAAVVARRTFGRLRLDGAVVRALPSLSAALILLVGIAITVRALPAVV